MNFPAPPPLPQACRGVVQRTETGPQHFPLTFNLSPLTFNLLIFYTDPTMIRVKSRPLNKLGTCYAIGGRENLG